MLGKTERKRRSRRQRIRWLDNITESTDMNMSKLRETVKDREAWCAADHGVAKCWTRQRPNNNSKKLLKQSKLHIADIPLIALYY